jgi:hypothetical protein
LDALVMDDETLDDAVGCRRHPSSSLCSLSYLVTPSAQTTRPRRTRPSQAP